MTGRKISKIVVITAVLGVILWDIIVAIVYKGNLEVSVSSVIWEFCRNAPIIPFASGVLCGHLFWGDPETSILWSKKLDDPKKG